MYLILMSRRAEKSKFYSQSVSEKKIFDGKDLNNVRSYCMYDQKFSFVQMLNDSKAIWK